jgi:hypothetical protein
MAVRRVSCATPGSKVNPAGGGMGRVYCVISRLAIRSGRRTCQPLAFDPVEVSGDRLDEQVVEILAAGVEELADDLFVKPVDRVGFPPAALHDITEIGLGRRNNFWCYWLVVSIFRANIRVGRDSDVGYWFAHSAGLSLPLPMSHRFFSVV